VLAARKETAVPTMPWSLGVRGDRRTLAMDDKLGLLGDRESAVLVPKRDSGETGPKETPERGVRRGVPRWLAVSAFVDSLSRVLGESRCTPRGVGVRNRAAALSRDRMMRLTVPFAGGVNAPTGHVRFGERDCVASEAVRIS